MTATRRQNVGKTLGSIALLCALLCLTGWARARLYGLPRSTTAGLKEVLLVPPGRVIRQVDLGYHSLAADLLFIRANLYYGQHLYTDEQLPWISDFVEVLLQVDPDFKKSYLWGALATTYYKREIDFVPRALVDRANRILERGMRRFPGDHRFPMRIAFNHYYEIGDRNAALPYFHQAAGLPGAPDWLQAMLVDLYTKEGSKDLARQILKSLVMSEDDPNLSKAMKDRLAHLMSPGERQAVESARAALMDEWRADYVALPFDLFLVVREP